MAKAINYEQNQLGDLMRLIDDSRIDLDINSVEHMFKPIFLVHKNALFIGRDQGAKAKTIHVTIIETCKLNKVNPERYQK